MPLDGWKPALDASTTPADIAKFVEHLHVDHLPHTVIIDCTADESVAKHYAEWLEGRHPRRHAEQEGQLRPAGVLRIAEGRAQGGRLLVSVRSHRGRRPAGDLRRCATCARPATRSSSIEGIFSGTLAYLFNVYDGKTAVLRHREGRQGQGLHRAGSARRPLGHGLRAQGHHPGPRDGPEARDEGRAGGKPDPARSREGHASTTSSPGCRSSTAR